MSEFKLQFGIYNTDKGVWLRSQNGDKLLFDTFDKAEDHMKAIRAVNCVVQPVI